MPDNRDHAMDLYRVVALLLIVVGHWVAACLTFSDGAFWRENPLVDLPWTQWLTWVFQVVPVFFVVIRKIFPGLARHRLRRDHLLRKPD